MIIIDFSGFIKVRSTVNVDLKRRQSNSYIPYVAKNEHVQWPWTTILIVDLMLCVKISNSLARRCTLLLTAYIFRCFHKHQPILFRNRNVLTERVHYIVCTFSLPVMKRNDCFYLIIVCMRNFVYVKFYQCYEKTKTNENQN